MLSLFVLAGIVIGISMGNKGQGKHIKPAHRKAVLPAASLLQSGDLIFRHGRGFISNAFRTFSMKDKKYSHAGIICIEKDGVFVYHAIGGEENLSNKLKRSSLGEFCDPENISAYGIYRYPLSDSEKAGLSKLVKAYYQAGLEFDLAFDMNTDNKMYCSEFIYKILCKVKSNKNFLPLSELNGLKYVAIDNLYMNSACHFVYSFTY